MRTPALAMLLVACTPTISQPRGETHLSAMDEATRHYHHGRFEEAADAWDRAAGAAERRVDRDEAEYRRARTLLDLDRDDEALVILDAIARRRPVSRRTVRARFDAALIQSERGQLEEARAAFTWIVNEHPGDGPAGRSLVLIIERMGPEEQVPFLRDLYERVGESDLGDDILFALSELAREAGDEAAAIAALERIVEEHRYPHGQRWDNALWQLADLAEERGDFAGAIAHLRRIFEYHERTVSPGSQTLPMMPEARMRIARIYRDRLHDPVRASEEFQGVYGQFETSTLRDDALYELGAMWLDAGQSAEGCAWLARVVAEFEVGHARRLAARRIEADCR